MWKKNANIKVLPQEKVHQWTLWKMHNFQCYFFFFLSPPHPLLFLTEVTLKLTLGNQKLFSTQRQNSMQATLAEIHTNHLHTRYHWNNTQDIIEITPNKIHLYKIFWGGQITSGRMTNELYKLTNSRCRQIILCDIYCQSHIIPRDIVILLAITQRSPCPKTEALDHRHKNHNTMHSGVVMHFTTQYSKRRQRRRAHLQKRSWCWSC